MNVKQYHRSSHAKCLTIALDTLFVPMYKFINALYIYIQYTNNSLFSVVYWVSITEYSTWIFVWQ